jgi:CCR4-NOT transcriptional regulation complex NOT5 subunit
MAYNKPECFVTQICQNGKLIVEMSWILLQDTQIQLLLVRILILIIPVTLQLYLLCLGLPSSIPSLKPEQMSFLQQSLVSSFQQRPDAQDLERPKQYIPLHPFATSLHYPNTPAPIFENSPIFQKFDLDTLFFIFYYQQGTYQQYWASRELKRQGWRFHKKYQAWFQRDEDPKYITDEYEQGIYLYFDYETNWCIRKKPDFTFEYMYLEHDEVP